MRIFWITSMVVVLLFAACGDGGGGGNGDGDNGGTNNMSVPEGECETDEDCPDASDVTFARPDTAYCWESSLRGNYCAECLNDDQCERGFACVDATYCEELPPCETGEECASTASEVHDACINGFCTGCIDDRDCTDDEVCYSRQCATRSAVDPTCIPPDLSCGGTCEIQYDENGGATGIECVE